MSPSDENNEMHMISALDLEHQKYKRQQQQQHMINSSNYGKEVNFIEDLFDMRAIYLAKEATSLSALPQLQFTSSVITIDFTNVFINFLIIDLGF